VRREIETSIQRGIVAQLSAKSLFKTRQNALRALIPIGHMILTARKLRHHHGALDDKYLDNLFTDSMEFFLALSPEEKRKEEYDLYCSSVLVSFGDGARVKGVFQRMNLSRGDNLPGLPNILLQLGIHTLTERA
jgi:hypothetical protein